MADHDLLAVVIGLQTAGLIGLAVYLRLGFREMLTTQMLIAKLIVQETDKVDSLIRH